MAEKHLLSEGTSQVLRITKVIETAAKIKELTYNLKTGQKIEPLRDLTLAISVVDVCLAIKVLLDQPHIRLAQASAEENVSYYEAMLSMIT